MMNSTSTPVLTLHRATFMIAALAILLAGCHRKNVDDLLATGESAMQAGNVGDAERAYDAAIAAAPNDPRTHIARGNLDTFEKKPEAAQIEFMKVIELDPKNAATHAALANLYRDQNQYGPAENQYRAAVALEPDNASYRSMLGAVLFKENKTPEAEAQMRTALGLVPKDANAHLALANLLGAIPGRDADAQAEMAAARALDPHVGETPAAAASSEASPSGAPTEAAGASPVPSAPASPVASGPPKVKPLNKNYLLTSDSAVYMNPDSTSAVVGNVHKQKYVRVTGIAGDYLQIRLKSGVTGYIPISAAE